MSDPKSRRIPHPIWFGIVAVLMVVLTMILSVWIPYHREQVTVRELERMGGVVYTYWSGPEWVVFGPEWLSKRTYNGSLSWFDRVNGFVFTHSAITDEGLKHLSGLSDIDTLYLDNTQISDEGLKHLSSLTNLELLFLDNTQVTSEGLKHLDGLENLEQLYLDNTQVGDEGLKNFRGLTNLDVLWLHGTQVTYEGVIKLQKALPDCSISY